MATYTLRNFNSKMAASGYRCVMLTGSHFEGNLIKDNSSDILAGAINVDVTVKSRNEIILTYNGVTYIFDEAGQCTTPDYNRYRLMLVEEEGIDIPTLLADLNDKLDTMNTNLEHIAEALGYTPNP